MEKQPKSYGEAIAEVEAILARFGGGQLDVDTLAAEVKRATELIAWCRARLEKAEKDVAEALEGPAAVEGSTAAGTRAATETPQADSIAQNGGQ